MVFLTFGKRRPPFQTRRFRKFTATAEGAGLSRIYAGQHSRFDRIAGERLGRHVADSIDHGILLRQDEGENRTEGFGG